MDNGFTTTLFNEEQIVDGRAVSLRKRLTQAEPIVDGREASFRKRLRQDPIFRRKFTLSIALYGLFACLGWNVSQLGPSLLDLQQITRTNLDEISYVLVAFSVGFVVGVVLATVLLERFNTIMALICTNLLIAITTAITPWCKRFALMVFVLTVRGVSHGINEAGGNVLILKIWGTENGPYMQTLHFCLAFGAVISPLAMAPFLATNRNKDFNSSMVLHVTGSSIMYNVSSEVQNETISRTSLTMESQIHGAFVTSASLVLVSAISFSYFICTPNYLSTGNQSTTPRLQTNMAKVKRSATIGTICGAFFIAMVLEKTVIYYLPTFVVEHLRWEKVQGSYALSTFWGAFSVARLIGIVLTKRFKIRHILGLYLSGLILSSIGLLITNHFKAGVGTWIFVPSLGFFLSTLFPCLMTWVELEFFKASGRLVSLFMVFGAAGAMITPLALGYLIDLYSPMWFCYFLLAFSIFMFAVYLILTTIVSGISPKAPETSMTVVSNN